MQAILQVCQRSYHVENTGSRPTTEAASGPVSTWMGDRLGTPGAVGIFKDRLVGLVVKASASRAEDPGFESRLHGIFLDRVIPVT